MTEKNLKVRSAMRLNKVAMWMLADQLGCHENTVLRRLRHELPETEQNRLLAIIEEIGKER